MAEAEQGSEQDDVSFLRTVSERNSGMIAIEAQPLNSFRKTWFVFRALPPEKEFA